MGPLVPPEDGSRATKSPLCTHDTDSYTAQNLTRSANLVALSYPDSPIQYHVEITRPQQLSIMQPQECVVYIHSSGEPTPLLHTGVSKEH